MMTRLALTLLLTWVSLCHSVVAWEADKDVRTIVLHTGSTNGFLATCTFPAEENDTTVILLTNIVGAGSMSFARPSSTSCGATPDI